MLWGNCSRGLLQHERKITNWSYHFLIKSRPLDSWENGYWSIYTPMDSRSTHRYANLPSDQIAKCEVNLSMSLVCWPHCCLRPIQTMLTTRARRTRRRNWWKFASNIIVCELTLLQRQVDFLCHQNGASMADWHVGDLTMNPSMPAPTNKNMHSNNNTQISTVGKINQKKTTESDLHKKFKNTSEVLPKIGRCQLAAVKPKIKRLLCVYLIHVLNCDLCRSQHLDVAVKFCLDLLRKL